jgi:hypothetical protein
MGLDITAYTDIAKIDNEEVADFFAYAHPAFPLQNEGIEGYHTGLSVHDFRAGSYSGYNQWRNHLCMMAHGVSADSLWHIAMNDWTHDSITADSPFVALINFSDCEGLIGPNMSAKLATDFDQYAEKAKAYAESIGDPYGNIWLSKYCDWRKAFEEASNNGCVVFH